MTETSPGAAVHAEPSTTRGVPGRFLSLSLTLDAVASGALGLLFAAGAGALDPLLGIGSPWLLGLGVFLVVFAGGVRYAAAGVPTRLGPAHAVVALNVLWVAASVTAVAAGWFDLTALGAGMVLLQAAAVALLMVLQATGLRRLS